MKKVIIKNGEFKMNIIPIIKSDIENIRHLQPKGWSDLSLSYEYYISNTFCFPVKLIYDNVIVGIGAAIVLGKTAWLGHIIVDQNYRRKGIGTAIVKHLLDILNQLGCNTVSLVSTDEGYPVYKSIGFTYLTDYVVFEKSGSSNNNLDNNNINIKKYSQIYKQEIFDIDYQMSGENRIGLLENELQNTLVYIYDNKVQGYYISGFGEGMIVSINSIVGKELMKFKYSSNNRGVIPKDNSDAIKFFIDNGFLRIKRFRRMFYGDSIAWKPKMLYSRLAGNLG